MVGDESGRRSCRLRRLAGLPAASCVPPAAGKGHLTIRAPNVSTAKWSHVGVGRHSSRHSPFAIAFGATVRPVDFAAPSAGISGAFTPVRRVSRTDRMTSRPGRSTNAGSRMSFCERRRTNSDSEFATRATAGSRPASGAGGPSGAVRANPAVRQCGGRPGGCAPPSWRWRPRGSSVPSPPRGRAFGRSRRRWPRCG